MGEQKLGPYVAQKAEGVPLPSLKIFWPQEEREHVIWDANCPKDVFAPLPDTIKAFQKHGSGSL